MIYNCKNLRLLFFTIFLIFNSCAVENFEEQEGSVPAGIKTRNINFNEFKNNQKASALISNLLSNQTSSNNALNRIIQDLIRNFSFDTNDGQYREYVNLHSYTFPIKRPVNNGKLENLVISYQNDGTYKVKLYSYDLTAQEKLDLELNKLNRIHNPVTSINIENFDTSFVTESCEEYTELVFVACGSGNHNSSNLEDWHFCTSQTKPSVYVRTRIKCIIDGGGPSGGGSNSDGPPAGGSGGDPSEEPNFPTAQTPPEEYILGITKPIASKPTVNNSPCDSIKSLIAAQQGKIKNDIDYLKTKVYGDIEFGVEVRKINYADLSYSFETARVTDNQEFGTELSTSGPIIGGLHNHPKRGNSIPSFADLRWLLNCHENASTGRKAYSFLMTVCQGLDGNPIVYNTKINNITALRDAVNLVWTSQKYSSYIDEKERTQKILEDESIYYGSDPSKLEKLFLEKYGNSGIDLYRSADFENLDWKKLELNSNPNSSTPVIANPC